MPAASPASSMLWPRPGANRLWTGMPAARNAVSAWRDRKAGTTLSASPWTSSTGAWFLGFGGEHCGVNQGAGIGQNGAGRGGAAQAGEQHHHRALAEPRQGVGGRRQVVFGQRRVDETVQRSGGAAGAGAEQAGFMLRSENHCGRRTRSRRLPGRRAPRSARPAGRRRSAGRGRSGPGRWRPTPWHSTTSCIGAPPLAGPQLGAVKFANIFTFIL